MASNDFHAVHRFADLQSFKFFSENSLWSNKLFANKSNSQELPFMYF